MAIIRQRGRAIEGSDSSKGSLHHNVRSRAYRPSVAQTMGGDETERTESVYAQACRVAWLEMQVEKAVAAGLDVDGMEDFDLYEVPLPEPAPGKCLFPLCGRPRKNDPGSNHPLCKAHAKQWQRRKYLTPTRGSRGKLSDDHPCPRNHDIVLRYRSPAGKLRCRTCDSMTRKKAPEVLYGEEEE